MSKALDMLIDNLRTQHYNAMSSEIEFKQLYKLDKEFTYVVDKKTKEVKVSYKKIQYFFTLPVIPITLSPPVSYLLFFKKRHIHNVVDTFQLNYQLALHYIICLNTFIKNNK